MAPLCASSQNPVLVVHQWDFCDEQGTPDEEWMAQLASRGNWIVISGDTRIKKQLSQRIAWLESGLTIFFMAKAYPQANEWEQVSWLARCWNGILQNALETPKHGGFVAHQNGQIEAVSMDALRSELPRDRKRLAKSRGQAS